MNKQRKVLITITYNEMGIIIDTKAEEVAQPNLQPTCNQLATDCISRQEAIDAFACTDELIVGGRANAQNVTNYINKVIGKIKALPSPQPEIEERMSETEQNVPNDDFISRKRAIDALDVLCQEHRYRIPGKSETYSQYNEAWQDALGRAENAIGNLPSVQPERTCVNCGRTINNGGWYADGRTRCPIEEHYALPKDGFCHLWEKRNITDDDYPERRTDE